MALGDLLVEDRRFGLDGPLFLSSARSYEACSKTALGKHLKLSI